MLRRQGLILFIKKCINKVGKKTSVVVSFFPILLTKFSMSESKQMIKILIII